MTTHLRLFHSSRLFACCLAMVFASTSISAAETKVLVDHGKTLAHHEQSNGPRMGKTEEEALEPACGRVGGLIDHRTLNHLNGAFFSRGGRGVDVLGLDLVGDEREEVVLGHASDFYGAFDTTWSGMGRDDFDITSSATMANTGTRVASAGDWNGNGKEELLAGPAPLGDRVYLVLGTTEPELNRLDATELDGTNGFALVSASVVGDVAGGLDLNGDGRPDVALATAQRPEGEILVVFGFPPVDGAFPAEVSVGDLDGTNGFTLVGEESSADLGHRMMMIDDLTGDGLAELMVSAPDADGDAAGAGKVYVVYGNATPPAELALSALDGENGFVIVGSDLADRLGTSIDQLGDFNDDGYTDLVVGASDARGQSADGEEPAGEVFVLLGSAEGFPAEVKVSELDGATGFRVPGLEAGERTGTAVTYLGDLNADGFDDLVLGAPLAREGKGRALGLLGHPGPFEPTVSLTVGDAFLVALGGADFDINLSDQSLEAGAMLGSGDFNGDGTDDLLIGVGNYDRHSDGGRLGAAVAIVGGRADERVLIDTGFEDGTLGDFEINGSVSVVSPGLDDTDDFAASFPIDLTSTVHTLVTRFGEELDNLRVRLTISGLPQDSLRSGLELILSPGKVFRVKSRGDHHLETNNFALSAWNNSGEVTERTTTGALDPTTLEIIWDARPTDGGPGKVHFNHYSDLSQLPYELRSWEDELSNKRAKNLQLGLVNGSQIASWESALQGELLLDELCVTTRP